MKTDSADMSFKEWAVKTPTAFAALLICLFALAGSWAAFWPAIIAADVAEDYRSLLFLGLGLAASIAGSVTISKWFNNQVVSFFSKHFGF
jgi:hypothetical protein